MMCQPDKPGWFQLAQGLPRRYLAKMMMSLRLPTRSPERLLETLLWRKR